MVAPSIFGGLSALTVNSARPILSEFFSLSRATNVVASFFSTRTSTKPPVCLWKSVICVIGRGG